MKLLKPQNLNLETMIKPNQMYSYITYSQGKKGYAFKEGNVYKKLIPYIYFFINQIIITDKSCDANTLNYSRIKSRHIEHIMTYNKMQQIVHFLTQQKIIVVKGISEFITIKGQQMPINAKYFKLLPEYCGSTEIIEVQLKIKTKPHISINPKAKEEMSKPEVQHQFELCSNYTFDFEGAEKYALELLNMNIIDKNYYIRCTQHIQRLRNKDVIFTISEKTHRITTLISLCPRRIRRFFLTDSIELDFQTFNVNLLVKLIDDNLTISNISQSLLNEIETISKETSMDFYNVIVEYFREKGFSIDRDTAKGIVLANWINNRPKTKSTEFNLMKQRYPEITKLMTELKGKTHDEYLKYTYKFMQIESELINNIIYKRFSTIKPYVKLYTICDCIMIESKYKDSLERIMFEESQSFFKKIINIKETKK